MYARELLMAGEKEDFFRASDFFTASAEDGTRDSDEIAEACCVVAHAARLSGNTVQFFKYTSKVLAEEANSEICFEMGCFYEAVGDFEEAAVWYYNAVYETRPILNLRAAGCDSLNGLIRCYEALGNPAQAEVYREELRRRTEENK